MAILAGCDYNVVTVGTFGWWAAFLGGDAKGGKVLYYDSEFVMKHQVNDGNVFSEDSYPPSWVAFGDNGNATGHIRTKKRPRNAS